MYMQITPNIRVKGRVAVALSALFLFALGVFAVPAQARAENPISLATCVGSHSATWSPGATNTPQDITVSTSSAWSCVQLQAPLITSAASTNQFTAQFSCQSLLAPAPATWTIKWGDDKEPDTSTYQFTAQVNAVSNNLVITAPGTITSGRYAGSSALGTFVLENLGATLQDLCASPGGVTSAMGASTLVITGLPPG